MHSNGLKRCAWGLRSSTAGLQHWRSTTSPCVIVWVKFRPTWDELSCLPVGPAPPEDALLHIQMGSKEEARRLAKELHTATHLGGQALWKLFSDRYSHKAGRSICIEVAQSCPQCQMGSDYGHRVKTTGSIQSKGPWDTLSVDIVGHSLPIADMSFSSCSSIASPDTPS